MLSGGYGQSYGQGNKKSSTQKMLISMEYKVYTI